MEFIPVENTVRVSMNYVEATQRIQNVFNVKFDSSPDISAMTTLADDFTDWWIASLAPEQAGEVSLQSLDLTLLTTKDDLSLEFVTGLPLTGGSVAAKACPNNVTVAVKWGGNLRGRSHRGRTYHIGLADNQVSGSTLTVGMHTALITAYTALLTKINVIGRNLCVVSYMTNKAYRTAGVTTPIVRVSIDSSLDSQRRRLPGRGE